MTDDQFKPTDNINNFHQDTHVLKNIGIGILCVFVFIIVFGILYMIPNPDSIKSTKSETTAEVKNFLPSPPPETREQYIASVKKVGLHEKDPIYYKELLKNPNKFKNVRLKIRSKIMNIEENNNETFLQVYISDYYDSIVVYYPQPVKVYKDDFIVIYGEGVGMVEGKNRMGAEISLPAVRAKYIEKYNAKNWN